MKITAENILLIGSILLFISILAGKTSYKFGVPTLVFFVAIGMLAGSEGVGGIYFNDPTSAQFIGVVALNFILFSGGLDTHWKAVKPIVWQGVTLSTLGVLVTATTVGAFVYFVTDFTLYESLLLGSIVSSTDAAAVFSILRSKSLALKYNLRPTLELESGSNDPMAYVLTIAFTGLVLNPEAGLISVLPIFLMQMVIGGMAGFIFGKLGKLIINQIRLDYVGLYPVLAIALMYFTFSATTFVNGNGFLAVYISAVFLGNQDLIHKKTIVKFFDGMAWLMQIGLFLTLGLLVFPSQMVPVIGIGLLISVFMILVARPVSVFLSLALFKVHPKSKWYISWVGLRGAVPIVFATYPLLAGVESAQMIFNIVFFISLTSVLIQGTSLPIIARWMNVALPEELKDKTPSEMLLQEDAKSEFVEKRVNHDSPMIGRRIVDLHFPATTVIAMIKRDNKFITPDGATVIQENDILMILSENKDGIELVSKNLCEL
jgi:NhaP-type Na+/H+ and K+/H+ antiporters with a unique C-terminal domain